MSSSEQNKEKSRLDWIRFKKQSLVGKIIFVSTVCFFGVLLLFNFFTLLYGKWTELGIYSVWLIFGWLFFSVLIYISFKIISMVMSKGNKEIKELESLSPEKEDAEQK
jgi:amino acid transporter